MKRDEKLIYAAIILSLLPFLFLFPQKALVNNDLIYLIGNISGYIGAVLLLWGFVLGNRTITRLINPDYTLNIRVHTILGVYGGLLIMLHPILEMLAYLQNLAFIFIPSLSSSIELYYSYGRVAFLLFLLIWITSALVRDKIKYRPWLYIHYVTYPLMALVFLHALKIGTFFNAFVWLNTYWYFLALTFIAVLIIRVLEILNLLKNRYVVVRNELASDNIWLLRIKPIGGFNVPNVGQFFYIKKSFIGESHPFSVTEFDESTGYMTFGYEAIGKFTNALSGVKPGQALYLDGPYGSFTKEGHDKDSAKIVIAGGIGVTPFVELIRRYSGEKTYLFYCNRYFKNAVYHNEFQQILGMRYFDLISREKVSISDCVLNCRFSLEVMKQLLPEDVYNTAKIFICGSPTFVDGITQTLQDGGVEAERIFFEDLGF